MKFLTMMLWLVVACVAPASEELEVEPVFTVPLLRGEEASVSEVLPAWVELSSGHPVEVRAPAHVTVERKRPGALEFRDEQGNLFVVDGLLATENEVLVGAQVCAGTVVGLAKDRWRVGAFEPSASNDPYEQPNVSLVRAVLRSTVRTLAEAQVYESVGSLLARAGEEDRVNAVPNHACPFASAVDTQREDESEVSDVQE
jgi:hypothetical protein